jgi:hypothetical protein
MHLGRQVVLNACTPTSALYEGLKRVTEGTATKLLASVISEYL